MRGQHPQRQQHSAAAKVPDQNQRWNRGPASRAYCVQRACQCNVINIMSGRIRKDAVLPPTSHASVYKAGPDSQACLRPQSKLLHRAEKHTAELQSLMGMTNAAFGLKTKKHKTDSKEKPRKTN